MTKPFTKETAFASAADLLLDTIEDAFDLPRIGKAKRSKSHQAIAGVLSYYCVPKDGPGAVRPADNPLAVWVSVLVPTEGAGVYDGARVRVSLSEEDCYRDLAEWLEIPFESKGQVESALEDEVAEPSRPGFGVEMWKVEEQRIFRKEGGAI